MLFVNGIPLVVIECKSPYITNPGAEAIDQLQRYANQRARIHDDEGNERLFHSNQFVIATYFDKAMVGTFTAEGDHFAEWKETEPVSREDVAAELGKAPSELSSQEILVAGMLRPAHLLDIVRNFTLLMPIEGRTVKIVGRYQQYRAVQRSIERLTTGKTRLEDGEFDRRGGIVWHTQGSGKSLTHGLPDPQDAHASRAAAIQGGCRDGPHGPAAAAQRHRGADRRDGRGRRSRWRRSRSSLHGRGLAWSSP